MPVFILGGGSNLLVSDQGFNGLVIKVEIKSLEFLGSELIVGSGEIWDDVVAESVARGYSGLENLSLIPGTVGGGVVQNLGAYGSELKDALKEVEVFDPITEKKITLTKEECKFAYRDSIFKHPEGKRLVVTKAVFSLSKENKPNTEYKDIKEYFERKPELIPNAVNIRNAVCEIRKNKLPDWNILGTAGSFFKNPVITTEHALELKNAFPELPVYETDSQEYKKVSASFVIDKICNLKSESVGDAGLYEKQALVLVNKGNSNYAEVSMLANKISETVKEKTKIILEEEVIRI